MVNGEFSRISLFKFEFNFTNTRTLYISLFINIIKINKYKENKY